MKTQAQRKADQRARDRAAGWREHLIKCHESDWAAIKGYVAKINKRRKWGET